MSPILIIRAPIAPADEEVDEIDGREGPREGADEEGEEESESEDDSEVSTDHIARTSQVLTPM